METFLDIINSTDRVPVFMDLNNILYRAFYVFTPDKFRSRQGLPNGHLFGLCQNLRTLDKLNYEVFLCEDSPCHWRKELVEDYKATRTPSENGTQFWKDYPKIHNIISDLPHCHTLIAKEYEADDVMYSAAKECSKLNKKCYIYTADNDLLQSIDDYITIAKKFTLKEVEEVTADSEYYHNKFPVTPDRLPIYRALTGDGSDNVEAPVKRFPKDLKLDIVDYLYCNGSLLDYNIKKESHKKWIKELIANWDKFINNYKIMKLNIIEFNLLDKEPKGSYYQTCVDYDLFQFMKYIRELQA